MPFNIPDILNQISDLVHMCKYQCLTEGLLAGTDRYKAYAGPVIHALSCDPVLGLWRVITH